MTDEAPILRRTFRADLETTEGRTVEGCCVPYGKPEKVADGPEGPSYYELFEPGAFAKQVGAPNRIELRYEHGTGLADSVGVCRRLWEDATGLYGAFAVNAGAFGDQALELVRNEILPAFSIEFSDRFRHWKRNTAGHVVRQKCVLLSVGLVREPAYQGALVTAIRSRAELANQFDLPVVADEQLERLRSVGIVI